MVSLSWCISMTMPWPGIPGNDSDEDPLQMDLPKISTLSFSHIPLITFSAPWSR